MVVLSAVQVQTIYTSPIFNQTLTQFVSGATRRLCHLTLKMQIHEEGRKEEVKEEETLASLGSDRLLQVGEVK